MLFDVTFVFLIFNIKLDFFFLLSVFTFIMSSFKFLYFQLTKNGIYIFRTVFEIEMLISDVKYFTIFFIMYAI